MNPHTPIYNLVANQMVEFGTILLNVILAAAFVVGLITAVTWEIRERRRRAEQTSLPDIDAWPPLPRTPQPDHKN